MFEKKSNDSANAKTIHTINSYIDDINFGKKKFNHGEAINLRYVYLLVSIHQISE